MKNFNTIIIGGGISGLYMAYQMIQKGYKDILLLERSSILGGRIRTDQIDGYPIELGAARFSNKHTKLLSLIQKLKLDDKKIKLSKDIDFYFKNKKINYDLHKYLRKLNSNKRKYTREYLEKINLLQYAVEILGPIEGNKLKDMYGYDAEFLKLNAYSALLMFQKDLLKDVDYYILKDGLSQIINKLEEYLVGTNKIKLLMDTNVLDIQKNKVVTDKNNYKCKRIVVTIPQHDIQRFHIFDDCRVLDSVKNIPLIRIYAKYPINKEGKVWFHDIQRTITDNFIRHIIPIDYEKGIIMISYTDYYIAEMWNNLYLLGEDALTNKIQEEIKRLFKIKIPKPLEYNVYYWKSGVHMWKTNHSMIRSYPKIMKPFSDKKIYISNESFCKHQCWIEGCLQMVKDVIRKIKNENKTTKQRGGRKKKRKLTIQNKKHLPKYTIKEVLKHKNWIIFEMKNQRGIYQISSSWFKNHPGGADNLKQGVKANTYYDKTNAERSKKSPLQLFKSIGAHSSSNVLKEYIMNEKYPKIIKLIGSLK
tara:strand:+ start:258 stop:1853 length:1596 start_codon:yes stop_codon:yes gene_type:complete